MSNIVVCILYNVCFPVCITLGIFIRISYVYLLLQQWTELPVEIILYSACNSNPSVCCFSFHTPLSFVRNPATKSLRLKINSSVSKQVYSFRTTYILWLSFRNHLI